MTAWGINTYMAYNKEWHRTYQKKNSDTLKMYRAEYYEKNKDVLKDKKRLYYLKTKEIVKARSKKYYEDHSEEAKLFQKHYYKKNSKKINIRQNIYDKNRRGRDINYKLIGNLRHRIREALKTKMVKKNKKTIELLGCSLIFLKTYLESQFKEGMSWDTHGYKGWHIDHIKPCSSFDLSDIEQQKKCFNYTNLQPLWWMDNIKKSDKIV